MLQELDRADKVKDIQAVSENLSAASDMFKKDSKALKNKEWWRMVKCYGSVALVIALLILVLVMYFCGIDFSQC